ncbi:MAG: NAD(P)-binding domain-containing protein [Clostridia bacterium]|nr:NAD(P)-binding domain-containing protein [Clostridia bacterium]
MTIQIGVLGTGQISSALVSGFCTHAVSAQKLHFYLSPRNQEKAAALESAYPAQVTVCASNQEVLDRADDWVILALLPRNAEEILTPLTFRKQQKIVSLISDHALEAVTDWTGPVERAIRMVPLPFVQLHIGPIACYPPDGEIRELFQPLGQLIELENEDVLNTVLTLTALMSPFYLLIHEAARWGKAHGLSDRAAVDYMTSFFEALSVMARNAPDNAAVATLCYDTTSGGLNEMAYRSIRENGGYQIWMEALDAVMERLNKSK